MSMHTYTTIGVYVECVNKFAETQVTKAGCVNVECKNYHVPWSYPGSYCSRCGKPASEYQVTEHQPVVDVWQLTDAIDQQMMPALRESSKPGDIDTWLPNVGGGVSLDDLEEDQAREITPLVRTHHLENFEQTYMGALAVLQQAYGEDNVTVKWGVVVETR